MGSNAPTSTVYLLVMFVQESTNCSIPLRDTPPPPPPPYGRGIVEAWNRNRRFPAQIAAHCTCAPLLGV